eukprot:2548510-Pyramimonas_sp.AAC.1
MNEPLLNIGLFKKPLNLWEKPGAGGLRHGVAGCSMTKGSPKRQQRTANCKDVRRRRLPKST